MFDQFEDLSDNPTIDSLTKLIGAEKLAELSAEFAGGRILIPKNPGPHSPLAVSIGLDSAIKISQVYGGMYFEVPVRPGLKARIVRLSQQGKGPTAIAREVGCSRRGVQKMLDKEAAKKQLSLFSPID